MSHSKYIFLFAATLAVGVVVAQPVFAEEVTPPSPTTVEEVGPDVVAPISEETDSTTTSTTTSASAEDGSVATEIISPQGMFWWLTGLTILDLVIILWVVRLHKKQGKG